MITARKKIFSRREKYHVDSALNSNHWTNHHWKSSFAFCGVSLICLFETSTQEILEIIKNYVKVLENATVICV